MRKLSAAAATVLLAMCAACSDRLTAPEAVELVRTVEGSIRPGGDPQRWLGTVFKSDLRLGAPLSETELRRGSQQQSYRAIVFERVVVPSARLGDAICAGTHRAAYFWRADSDGVVFFPGGWFDQSLVPGLRGCAAEIAHDGAPSVRDVSSQMKWWPVSVEGEISPGVVTGACIFLQPEAERVLREEHGITCALTQHQVRFGAELRTLAGELDTMRLELDSAEVIGVRYTIDCDAAKSAFSVPCADPRGRASKPAQPAKP